MEKKIKVGIDGSEAEQYQSKLRKLAEETMRGMIRDARAYTTSAKETNKDLDEQIKLLEKRNRLEKDKWESEVKAGRAGGQLSPQEYKTRMAEVSSEKREDKLLIQEIRSLREDINRNAKQEIRESRTAVERTIQNSKTVNQLAPQGDQLKILKETLQQDQLSGLGNEEMRQRYYPTVAGMENFSHSAMGILQSQDAVGMGSSAAMSISGGLRGYSDRQRQRVAASGGKGGGKGSAIAAIAAMIGGAVIKEFGGAATELESSMGDYAILNGGSVRNMMAGARDQWTKAERPEWEMRKWLPKMGMSLSDYYKESANLEMMSRTRNYGADSPSNLMALYKGTALGEQDVAGMAGLRRFGGGGVSTTASFFEKYLQQTNQSLSVLPEIIGQFTTEAKNIIMQTGSVDTNNLATMFAKVGQQTGFQGDLLGNAMGTLGKGMTRSSNPVIQAMQFKSARGVAGKGASLWDIEKIMADPLSNPAYIQAVLDDLKSTSGGGDNYERAISNVLGVNPNLAASFANIDLNKNVMGQIDSVLKEEKVGFFGRADQAFGETEETRARMRGMKETAGAGATEWAGEKVNDLFKWLQDFKVNTEGISEKISDLATSMKTIGMKIVDPFGLINKLKP